MWPKEYKDYPIDEPLIKCKVEPGKGIIGCEMHEINGWGIARHVYRPSRKRGPISTFVVWLLGEKETNDG